MAIQINYRPVLNVPLLSSFLITSVLIVSVGCASKDANQVASKTVAENQLKESQLYKDIGGQAGIEKLVDAFVKRIVADKEILPYFAKSSVTHFKQGFISHLCTTVDGPCQYDGDNMVDIHTGMQISEADFNRVVELLIKAMEDVDITYPNQNRILAKLAVLREQIIKI